MVVRKLCVDICNHIASGRMAVPAGIGVNNVDHANTCIQLNFSGQLVTLVLSALAVLRSQPLPLEI